MRGLKEATGENSNPLFVVPATASPIISKEAHLKLSAQKKLYVYDIPTKRGQVINLYVDR